MPQAQEIVQDMSQFMQRTTKDTVERINKKTNDDVNYNMEKMIADEREKIVEKFEADLEAKIIDYKIHKSKLQNGERINKMRQTNAMVESLLKEAKVEMHNQLQADEDRHKELIKDLMVQGFIKMIEPRMILKVRQSDVDLIESQLEDAIAIYKEKMLNEVEAFKGKDDFKCNIEIDKNSFLPEWNEEDPKNSCLGGFIMYAKKNRIVCSQTLDDRMALVY